MYYEHIAFRVPVRREMFLSQVVTPTKVLKSTQALWSVLQVSPYSYIYSVVNSYLL